MDEPSATRGSPHRVAGTTAGPERFLYTYRSTNCCETARQDLDRMPTGPKPIIGLVSLLLPLLAVWANGRMQDEPAPNDYDREVHRLPGVGEYGQPSMADPDDSGLLKLTIVDAQTRQPVFCRVNVVGSDGNFYEPTENDLSPWSLQRLGNRREKGPFRYYGWFFYCDGRVSVRVPPGKARIEVWKGFEYGPRTVETAIAAGETSELAVTIHRSTDMAARGWYSGDTHIHLDRQNEIDDQRALDLAAAEDIRFAHILCMNDPRTYQPSMDQQIWPQRHGLGRQSERLRGIYAISSGQEYRCGTFGHICLVGHRRLVDADGLRTDPNNWPVFGVVSDETRSLGGRSIHAHGGYEKEIYADFAQQATDAVELLQFAVYRGIGLEGWYHILNAGFRFPALGASDYPYCRALGDCRTYVYLGDEQPTFENWDRAAIEGCSFFTTGPLVELTVNDARPSATLDLPAGSHLLDVKLQVTSLLAAIDEVQFIAAGQVVARLEPKQPASPDTLTWEVTLPVQDSTWIAARAFARSPSGREDVEAHTNPVFVTVDGRRVLDQDSVEWLLAKLQQQIDYHAGRSFKEEDKVLAYFEKSRQALRKLAEKE